MKIINARTGELQAIPFALGESGRGRHLEEVRLSNRPGQTPEGPEDVGYFVFGQEQKHCILTKTNPSQRGVLVRIATRGTYTRYADGGSVKLVAGDAELLAVGHFADGDAGNLGCQSDELWHVKSPAVFVVVLSGGAGKGYGHRYVIVTADYRVVMIARDALCQHIATDEDPEVAAVARMYRDKLHEDVRAAVDLADQLDSEDVEPTTVTHFFGYKPIGDVVAEHGFAVPVALQLADGSLGGVAGVTAGTLVPGDKALVVYSVAPMGGKRYRAEVVEEAGVTRLHTSQSFRGGDAEVLALVDASDWRVVVRHFKDGAEYCVVCYDAGGTHHATAGMLVGETTPWAGREKAPPATPFFQPPVSETAEAGEPPVESELARKLREAGLTS